jgi:predicted secreted protein
MPAGSVDAIRIMVAVDPDPFAAARHFVDHQAELDRHMH